MPSPHVIEYKPLKGWALSPNFEEVRDLDMAEVESKHDKGEPEDIYKLANRERKKLF